MPRRASSTAPDLLGAAAVSVVPSRRPGVDGGERGRSVQVVGERVAHRGADLVGLVLRGGRQRRAPHLQPPRRALHLVGEPLPVVPVVVAEQSQPDRLRVVAGLTQRGDEDEVALGLRHLLALVGDQAGVDVGLGERQS